MSDPLREVAAAEPSSEVRLSREMGLLDITMIGVGAMIGAGIFVLTGIAAGVAGPALILVFFLNGFVALFAAAAYAELGSSFHSAGGGYLYVKTGLKDPHGFLSGWMSWFAYMVACALYALGFGAYFEQALPLIGLDHVHTLLFSPSQWAAVAVVIIFSFINYRGASEAGGTGTIITGSKIVLLVIFVGFGIWATLHQPHWQMTFTKDFMPNGIGNVFIAMGLTFIAFEGYEIIAQCSEEVREPERNVPRAIFLSLAICIPIYLLVAFAALGAAAPDGMASWQYLGKLKEAALVEVAKGFFPGGGILILVGGLFSTISALNATIFSSSRVSFAMGRDRNLPAFFGKVHGSRKTPHWAIMVSGCFAGLMVLSMPIEVVASASNIMFLLLFIQVQAALISLRKKRPDLPRGFKVPWVPLIPAIGIVLQLVLAVFLFFYSPMAWLSAAVWIALGLAIFYLYSRRRDHSYGQLLAVREAAELRRYRIVACIGNLKKADTILNAAAAIARKFEAELVALSVVEVHDNELLAKGLDRAEKTKEQLEATIARSQLQDLSVRAIVKVSHRISYGITETALEEQCNLIVMGRVRGTGFLERLAATVVDRVVRSAPAQVIVISADNWPAEAKSIVFAYEPGPHSKLTADVVDAFSNSTTRIQTVNVLPYSATLADMDKARADLDKAMGSRYVLGEQKVVRATDIVSGLLRCSEDADIIVTGGTDAGMIEQLLGYALPFELADRTDKAVAIVYEMPADPKRWLIR